MPAKRISVTIITRRGRHPAVVFIGALASLALNALLVTPMLLGSGKHTTQAPEAPGTAANAERPGADDALIVELIDERDSVPRASARIPQIAPSLTTASVSLRPVGADMPSLPMPDPVEERESQSRPAQAEGDDATAALLYGRYLGQITARVERAWLKPRSSVGADRFVCRVQVLQDESGQVREVTLIDCNGDERWQSSLVRAIQSASPLSAPPDPRVFNRRITLQFDSEAFVAGGNSEGFEPQGVTAMNSVPARSVVSGPRDVLQQLRSLRKGDAGEVDLRIGGSP